VADLRKVTALIAIASFLLGAAAVSADWVVDSMDSVLGGPLGSLDLHCVVTTDGSLFTYTYDLTATAVVNPVHLFDVGNPYRLVFGSATNAGASHSFKDPTYKDYLTSVAWANGQLKFGETGTFVYLTAYQPMEVHTSVSGGGISSDGITLGMVPEPGSLSLVGLCFLAGLGYIRRR
jgi:hypothetical protein